MMMNILDNFLILLIIVAAFIAGKLISDRYNQKLLDEYEYVLKIMNADRIGYIASPRHKVTPIGQPFMDKLRETGRAVQQVK